MNQLSKKRKLEREDFFPVGIPKKKLFHLTKIIENSYVYYFQLSGKNLINFNLDLVPEIKSEPSHNIESPVF